MGILFTAGFWSTMTWDTILLLAVIVLVNSYMVYRLWFNRSTRINRTAAVKRVYVGYQHSV